MDWKIQLYLGNAGKKAHRVPISVEPDGPYAHPRIEEGQIFDLSMKVML